MLKTLANVTYCLVFLLLLSSYGGAQERTQQLAPADLAVTAAAAAPAIAPGGDDFVEQWFKEHVKGTLKFKNFMSFKTTIEEQTSIRQEGVLRLDITQDLNENFRLFLAPQWKADTRNYVQAPWQTFRDSTARDPYFSFHQGYLRYKEESFDVTVGKQIYSWGTADGYNPTDYLLNPWDYQDIPDREKIGTFSISANYYLPDTSFQFIVIPLFTPSRIPMVNNRWLGIPNLTFFGVPIGKIGLPVIDFFIRGRRKLPPKRFENTEVAFRAKTSAITGWDLSLSYFDGFDNLPIVSAEGPLCIAPKICVGVPKTIFSRVRAIGADFSTTFGKLEVHGEAQARFYDGGRTTDRLPIVFGGRYVWDQADLAGTGLEQILFVLEYGHDIDLHKRDNILTRDLNFFVRPIQSQIMSRIGLKIDDANEFNFSTALNFYGPNSGYVQPKYTYKFTDNLKADIGLDIFWGSFTADLTVIPPKQKFSFWGKWERNDRGFLNLTYLF